MHEKCKGCNWTGKCLRSHLAKRKDCSSLYDLDALEAEAKKLHKEQMAARNRDRYHNDKDESPRKRASVKQQYHESPQKKRESMAAYNEKHRPDINKAMMKNYHENPEKKQEKSKYYYETKSKYVPGLQYGGKEECSQCDGIFYGPRDMKRHVDNVHLKKNVVACQICDKDYQCKQSLERHMTEVHGGEKHKCEKCPAAFCRASDLQYHTKHGLHYLSYHCRLCKKTFVFQTLGGLIEHTIVKQSEEEHVGSNGTWRIMKSGILLTCKSHMESKQLKEGKDVSRLTWKDKAKAKKERAMKKEEIINEGLQLAYGNLIAPKVKVDIKQDKHEKDVKKDQCKWCEERAPYSDEFCSINCFLNWKLLEENE